MNLPWFLSSFYVAGLDGTMEIPDLFTVPAYQSWFAGKIAGRVVLCGWNTLLCRSEMLGAAAAVVCLARPSKEAATIMANLPNSGRFVLAGSAAEAFAQIERRLYFSPEQTPPHYAFQKITACRQCIFIGGGAALNLFADFISEFKTFIISAKPAIKPCSKPLETVYYLPKSFSYKPFITVAAAEKALPAENRYIQVQIGSEMVAGMTAEKRVTIRSHAPLLFQN